VDQVNVTRHKKFVSHQTDRGASWSARSEPGSC